jgi:hypothetical protein
MAIFRTSGRLEKMALGGWMVTAIIVFRPASRSISEGLNQTGSPFITLRIVFATGARPALGKCAQQRVPVVRAACFPRRA